MTKLPPDDQHPAPASVKTPNPRREFLRSAGLFTGTVAALGGGLELLSRRPGAEAASALPDLVGQAKRPLGPYDVSDPVTPYQQATSYNNFYEFGTDKADPARLAASLKPRPWTVKIDGEVKKPQTVDIDTLQSWFPLEDRIYRMRCVEGWSMVMPWLGFPLAGLIRRLEPTSKAKYVQFTALFDPKQFPGQRCQRADLAVRRRPAAGRSAPSRWRSWRSASTDACCRGRTALRCAWWCRGSTASRASNPSCGSP